MVLNYTNWVLGLCVWLPLQTTKNEETLDCCFHIDWSYGVLLGLFHRNWLSLPCAIICRQQPFGSSELHFSRIGLVWVKLCRMVGSSDELSRRLILGYHPPASTAGRRSLPTLIFLGAWQKLFSSHFVLSCELKNVGDKGLRCSRCQGWYVNFLKSVWWGIKYSDELQKSWEKRVHSSYLDCILLVSFRLRQWSYVRDSWSYFTEILILVFLFRAIVWPSI